MLSLIPSMATFGDCRTTFSSGQPIMITHYVSHTFSPWRSDPKSWPSVEGKGRKTMDGIEAFGASKSDNEIQCCTAAETPVLQIYLISQRIISDVPPKQSGSGAAVRLMRSGCKPQHILSTTRGPHLESHVFFIRLTIKLSHELNVKTLSSVDRSSGSHTSYTRLSSFRSTTLMAVSIAVRLSLHRH